MQECDLDSRTIHNKASNQYQSYRDCREANDGKEHKGPHAVVVINRGPDCCVSRRCSGEQNQYNMPITKGGM